MIDARATLVRDIERAFRRDMRSFLKLVNITRNATDSVFDPVEETTSGGTDGLDEDTKGIFRKYKKYLIDDINIKYTDTKLTIIQSDISFEPKINDVVNSQYRVINVTKDAADCLYTLQLRGIPL